MKYPKLFVSFVALFLSVIAIWRGEFSLSAISAPLKTTETELSSSPIEQVLNQPYFFLGKGRQTFAFESSDHQWVIKFFNRNYLEMPWYSFALWDLEKEQKKREARLSFYLHSYAIANQYLKSQTCLAYCHLGFTRHLPIISVKDQTGKILAIDLNKVPFVIQKKGTLLCEQLKKSPPEEKEKILESFLEIIQTRIAQGIADADHDVEHNFGYLEGQVFHLDPGRLFFDDLHHPDRKAHEWWSATHALRKWLELHEPNLVEPFDARIAAYRSLHE